MIEINYKQSTIDSDGVASIVGIKNGSRFIFNVHYDMGFTRVEQGELSKEEKHTITTEFQSSQLFKDTFEKMYNIY